MANHIDKGGFGLMKLMKRNPETAPVIVVCAAGCLWTTYFLGRLAANPMTVWDHSDNKMPWVNQPQSISQHFSWWTRVEDRHLQDQGDADLRGKL